MADIRKSAIRRTTPALSTSLLIVFVIALLTGCGLNVPPQPTVQPTVTEAVTSTTTPENVTRTASPRPSPTLPATWTPVRPTPTIPLAPTVTLPPTNTPLPPTTTPNPNPVGQPVSERSGDRVTITLSEAQLNAALARRFDAAPLPNYKISPRATLGNGNMVMTLQIVPARAPAGSGPLTMALTLELGVYSGMMETRPAMLNPLNAGVTTGQVKLAEKMLLDTLNAIVAELAQAPALLFTNATIRPDALAFEILVSGS